MKIIDLSVTLVSELPVDPVVQQPKINYLNHKDTVQQMANMFEGATVDDLPEGNGWAVEIMQISTHTGTHLDAPYHYYPTMNNGERAWTIDEVPLEWCIGPGVKVDMSNKPDGYKITKQDVIEYLETVNYQLNPGDILLLQTGAHRHWGTAEYMVTGPGMSAEATEWIIDQGVKVMGTDGWSWDVPLAFEGKEFKKNGDASVIWEAHRVGSRKAYCHIEKLVHLDLLPVSGYTISCLPVKIERASAGWCRAIAIFNE